VIIDTFNDKRNGYRFQVNPNGLRMEGIFVNTTNTDMNWNGIWQAAATTNNDGWSAEMLIPFKTLSFDPNNDTWGINFERDISRGEEGIAWVSRNQTTNPSIAGIAVGFEDLQLGRGLDVVPSVVLNTQKTHASPGANNDDTAPSLDIYYKITPSLNSALTFNTDFSATEVDDRQVELTRFNLFFPEKRDFFLRDSDIFQFGRIGSLDGYSAGQNDTFSRPDLQSAQPFFSRRIGLSANGQPVDLDIGGKLAGRVGGWNLGALAIQQAEHGDVTATDIFVGRAAMNILEESTIGMIVTDGDPRSNKDNSLIGADFRYANTRLAGGRALEADLWYQQSNTDGIDEKDTAYGFRLRAPNSTGFRGQIGFKEIEENFFPALGYVNRSGVRDQTFKLGYTKRPPGGRYTAIYSGIDAQRIELITGGLQTQVVTLRALEIDSSARTRGYLYFHATQEALTETYKIWERGLESVVIPTGNYSFNETELQLQSDHTKTFWGSINHQSGDFYDGERERSSIGLGWRPSIRFRTTLNYTLNDVKLPHGDFTTRLVQLRSDVIFSSTLSWVTLLQYDDISETMGINARLHWIPEAGREAYIVLNHNLQDFDRDNRYSSVSADLALKLNYTFRF
ncbi:MAG: DUF5916 domain-containing protein, partial [Gammaproteobacteria bacterium]|nr:DUF5916 domain-containing protein [Gammaproteobacteria bacterium]